MMDIDVDVEYSGMDSAEVGGFLLSILNTSLNWAMAAAFCTDLPQELQNGEHNVVDVAEAARLKLLGVVQAPSPVDGDVRLT